MHPSPVPSAPPHHPTPHPRLPQPLPSPPCRRPAIPLAARPGGRAVVRAVLGAKVATGPAVQVERAESALTVPLKSPRRPQLDDWPNPHDT